MGQSLIITRALYVDIIWEAHIAALVMDLLGKFGHCFLKPKILFVNKVNLP